MDNGVIKARVNVKIEDGPSKGRTCTYEDEVNTKSSLYVARSLTACGWKGKDLATVAADVDAWVKKTGGKSTAEIKHIPTKKGTIWDKCNSIGRGPKPLKAPAGDALADANAAMREALALDGSAPDDGGVEVDDAPFCTMSRVGLGEIAKVLR